MNEVVTVAAWAAALLLIAAGGAKVRRPAGTAVAMRAASLPSHPAIVRLLGAAEVLVGTSLLALGGRVPAALMAISYVGFAVFAARHRQRPGASCGCFGEATGPLGLRHVVVDGAVAVVLLAAVAFPPPAATALLGGAVLTGLLASVTVLVAVWLLRLHLTDAVALDEAVALSRGGTP